jgi:hypothetical protein
MAFTRFNYDDARTEKRLQEATDVGRWTLNVPVGRLHYSDDPHIRLQKWGANLSSSAVDVENYLQGRENKGNKYCDGVNPAPSFGLPTSHTLFSTTMKAVTDESRATHPVWWFRDLEQTRWEYPLKEQLVIKQRFQHVDSRNMMRDSYNR